MNLLDQFQAIGLSLMFLLVTFIPMEKMFPAKKGQPIFRPQWRLDLYYFLGQNLLWIGLVFWTLDHFEHWLNPFIAPTFRAAVILDRCFCSAKKGRNIDAFCLV